MKNALKEDETNKRFPCGIMGTVCIPWDAAYELEERLFRKTIDTCRELTGMLYLGGTAGEGYALDTKRFSEVHRVFIDQCDRTKDTCIAGIISTSFLEILERIEIAASLGFRYIQISLPCWDPPKGEEILVFFDRVLSSFPELDFMHYNRPLGGRTVSASEYAAICHDHDNLVAAKIVTGSTREIDALHAADLPIELFYTNAAFQYASLLGPSSLLAAIVTVDHSLARSFYQAGRDQDAERLLRLNRLIRKMTSELVSIYPEDAHIDGAYDKLYHKIHDPDFPLRLIPPYKGADQKIFQEFSLIVQRNLAEFRTYTE